MTSYVEGRHLVHDFRFMSYVGDGAPPPHVRNSLKTTAATTQS